MAVRIYDLAHKYQITSKQVLAFAAKHKVIAKSASSSLDKITAVWFEEQLLAEGCKPIDVVPAEPTPIAAPVPTAILPLLEPLLAPISESTEELPAKTSAAPLIAPSSAPSITPDSSGPVKSPVSLTQDIPRTTSDEPAPLPVSPSVPSPLGFRFTPKLPNQESARTVAQAITPLPRKIPVIPSAHRPPAFRHHNSRTGSRGPTPAEAGASAAAKSAAATPQFAKVIHLKPPIIVKDLAAQLGLKPFQLIHELMEMNVFASINQTIDEDAARQVCARHQVSFEVERRERHSSPLPSAQKSDLVEVEDPALLELRPPVVTIMGHVDHGKTSLLDAIRKTNVVAGESGGITQHIGAYTIIVNSEGQDRRITFLDTPGHEAFAKMRARGANVTDIAILVVGADDGVQPQTIESINHARAANVPIIVALNKIDKPNVDVLRVKKQLQAQNLAPEDWGGQTVLGEVSALSGQGIDRLLALILLQADFMELKANPKRRAKGNVIESALEPGRGPVATLLVRNGTLKVSDAVVVGPYWGKIKALLDQGGKRLKEAPPSTAVQVLGLTGVPEAGIEFEVVPSEKIAREISDQRQIDARQNRHEASAPRVTLETLFAQIASDLKKELKIVLKADMQGSLEAIKESLAKLPTNKIKFEIIHGAVGNITENDILLAAASKALVIGFHVRPESGVNDLAEHEGIEIRLYTIIYELIDACKKAQEGLLDPILKEVVVGHATIRQVFDVSNGAVAGCIVSDGRISRTGRVRLLRRGKKEYEGSIGTLRRFQDDVNEVRAGLECGLRLSDFKDYQVGDVIECYQIEKVAQKL